LPYSVDEFIMGAFRQLRFQGHMNRSSAVAVLAQLPTALEHFNRVHPHSESE
jgi:hypothetical protein